MCGTFVPEVLDDAEEEEVEGEAVRHAVTYEMLRWRRTKGVRNRDT